MDGTLYDGSILLARGVCTLSSDNPVATGTIVVDSVPNLLNHAFLTLRLSNGDKLDIIPRRVEHSAGARAMLLFDVTP